MLPQPIHCAYAVEVLGIALQSLFPGTQILETSVSEEGFRLNAVLLQPMHPDMIPLLEEKMRRLMKEGVQFQQMEMMADNAGSLLESLGQEALAERAFESDLQTVILFRSGDYANFSPIADSHFPLGPEILEVKLWNGQTLGMEIEIEGVAFPDKADLKAFVKSRGQRLKEDSERRVIAAKWMTEEGVLLPEGIRNELKWRFLWSSWVSAKGFVEVATGAKGKEAYPALLEKFTGGIAEWATLPERLDLITIEVPEAQVHSICISSLQFILETAKILDLGIEWIAEFQQSPYVQGKEWSLSVSCLKKAVSALSLCCEESVLLPTVETPTLTAVVIDKNGRRKKLSFLRISFLRGKKRAQVQFSLLGPLEQFFALQVAGRGLVDRL